jgi:hypothetical protein
MLNLLLVAADIAIFFGFALAISYVWTQIQGARHEIHPYPGCRVRIRGNSQIYRCRLEWIEGNHWCFGPPIVRDELYPLKRGESIIGEIVLDSGTLTFRSEIAFSDGYKGRIWVKVPKRTFWREFGQPDIKAAPAVWDGSGRSTL